MNTLNSTARMSMPCMQSKCKPSAPRCFTRATVCGVARSSSNIVSFDKLAAVAPTATAVAVEKTVKPLNIVMVAAEVAPWSKTGGLGDVTNGLPIELAKRGHSVMTIAPRRVSLTLPACTCSPAISCPPGPHVNACSLRTHTLDPT